MIGRFLHRCEEKGEVGKRVDEVVAWYLEQHIDDILTDQHFEEEQEIVKKVYFFHYFIESIALSNC